MKLEASSFSGLTGQQLHNAAKMCILALTLVLASCQNEYMRNPFWSGAPQYQNQYGYQYNNQYQRAYQASAVQQPAYRGPLVVNTRKPATQNVPLSRTPRPSSTKYLNTSTSRKPKDQSLRILPPIPSDGYTARWDKTPVTGSPSGGYWVVNSRGQTWYLKPANFWPFWANEVWNRRPIKVFDPYKPIATR